MKKLVVLFFISGFIFGCSQTKTEVDFIDKSMKEFSKYFESNNVFMLVYCTDNESIINIHVEARNRKVNFTENYIYCDTNNKCVDIVVVDNCLEIKNLIHKNLEKNIDAVENDTIYSHTGDDSLSEYRFISIRYDVKNNKVLATKTYDRE